MFTPIADCDIPAIVTLMNRAYRGPVLANGWSTEAPYIAGDRTNDGQLRADLLAHPHAVLLKWAESSSETISGCVWLNPLDDRTWYLGSLAADPAEQNRGLGRRLLAAAEDWVRAHGGSRVQMSVVNVREALIAWYVRRGYRLTGETEPFPYGDNRFGTPLRDDLHFVVLQRGLVADSDGLIAGQKAG